MTEVPAYFREFNNATHFGSVQLWRDEDKRTIEYCEGVWEWEQVSAVSSRNVPCQYEEVEGPLCFVWWGGRHLCIRADYNEVLQAYLRYKSRYGGEYIRLLAN